jgi:hypothetical protein
LVLSRTTLWPSLVRALAREKTTVGTPLLKKEYLKRQGIPIVSGSIL